MNTAIFTQWYYGAAKDCEAGIHRGWIEQMVQWEDWICSEDGDARDLAWLLATYDALGVPQTRRADMATLEVRAWSQWGDGLDVVALCAAARTARTTWLARVRANLEAERIAGWRVLDSDPPAEAEPLEDCDE